MIIIGKLPVLLAKSQHERVIEEIQSSFFPRRGEGGYNSYYNLMFTIADSTIGVKG